MDKLISKLLQKTEKYHQSDRKLKILTLQNTLLLTQETKNLPYSLL